MNFSRRCTPVLALSRARRAAPRAQPLRPAAALAPSLARRWWYGGVWEPAVSDAAATCWDAHLTNSWYRVSFKQWCSVFSDLELDYGSQEADRVMQFCQITNDGSLPPAKGALVP